MLEDEEDFEGSGFNDEMMSNGFGNGNGDEEEEEEDDDSLVYFVIEESTGYMAPTLKILSILHTLLSFLCIIGYNCLKVRTNISVC